MRARLVGDRKSGAAGGWKKGEADPRAGRPVLPRTFFSNHWEHSVNIVTTTDLQARLPLLNELP